MVDKHKTTIQDARKQFAVIFKESKQGIYIYLDDKHKLCNEKFAAMLGYKSAKEWEKVNQPFTEAFVEPESQHTLVSAYQEAMDSKTGSCIDVAWKKPNGRVNTRVILIPISIKGHLLALHYITET